MQLSEGLNVIVGESSHGKSAIYRALNWLYDNAGQNPRQYIKKGALFAKVTIELSNGYRISRLVESKRSGKNGYEIFDPNTKKVVSTNTKGVDSVRELLGFHKVPLDGGKELDINFMGQGESWFFIGKHVTPSDRAKMIGSIFGTHYTDSVLKDMEGTLKKTDGQYKGHKEQWEELQKEIDTYTYLEGVEKRVSEAQDKMKRLGELSERKAELERLKAKQERLIAEEDKWKAALKTVAHVDQARLSLIHLQTKQATIQLIGRHNQILTRIDQDTKTYSATLSTLKGLDDARTKLGKVTEIKRDKEHLVAELQRYTQTNDKLKRLEELIEKQEVVLKETDQTALALTKFMMVKMNAQALADLKKAYGNYETISARITKGQVFLKGTQQELDATLNEYEEVLLHMGTCPTCHGTIDTAVVKQVVNSHR